jgi:GNAT superfamily N-acetyltransferase
MHVRQVLADEEALVAEVLMAAAGSLVERGCALWSSTEVSEVAVRAHVHAGMYYVAVDEEGPIGVFRFQLEDRYFWPEVLGGSSAFIHKLAIYPHRQGRGFAQALLGHACELARQHGRSFLRLDCMGGRPKLRAIYEQFGFRHHSDKMLGDQLFHRFELEVGGGLFNISIDTDLQQQEAASPQGVLVRSFLR